MLAKDKLNTIETLISQALNEVDISHKEYITILKQKGKYERMKDILKIESEKCVKNTKNKERIQKFKETGDTSYIYKNELDKACFQHDMAYGDLKI